MVENNLMRKSGKKDVKLQKLSMYKDTAKSAMYNLSDYDKKVLDINNEYLEKLCQADQPEYSILLENLKLTDSEEERADIRARMVEMKNERYQKDTENKEFCNKQQEKHKYGILQIVGSVAFVTGVVGFNIFKKRIMGTSKNLITKE